MGDISHGQQGPRNCGGRRNSWGLVDRSSPLFYFVTQDSHSQAGSTRGWAEGQPGGNRR